MSEATWKLDELARAAGVSARTVRYYVQRGLLPAPAFHGKDTAYGREHLVRLRAVRRLQERHLPLDAIQGELAGRTLAQLERLALGLDPPPEQPVRVPAPAERAVQSAPGAAEVAGAERWRRLALGPGLELWLQEGADEHVQRLAHALALCLRGAPPSEAEALARLLSERAST